MMQQLTDNHCAADPRRRTKSLICMLSAPRVHRQLQDAGLRIKSDRSVYRRFEPANENTKYAKIYHKTTIKAKMGRMRNDNH